MTTATICPSEDVEEVRHSIAGGNAFFGEPSVHYDVSSLLGVELCRLRQAEVSSFQSFLLGKTRLRGCHQGHGDLLGRGLDQFGFDRLDEPSTEQSFILSFSVRCHFGKTAVSASTPIHRPVWFQRSVITLS